MVTVRWKGLHSGALSAYFDIHFEGKRWYEFLKIYTIIEKSSVDREVNRELRKYVERIKVKRTNELLNVMHGLAPVRAVRYDFFEFAESIIQNYTGNKRGLISSVKRLRAFWGEGSLLLNQIDLRMLNKYYDYLDDNLNGATPQTYIKKIAFILQEAKELQLILSNPASGIKYRRFYSKQKEMLTAEEMKKLIRKRCPNINVKAAFIFAWFTGIRSGDLRRLKGSDITGNILRIKQQKTQQYVTVVLNAEAQKLVANRIKGNKLLFNLPSHTAILKSLRVWVKNSNINKKITSHSARYSAATNLIASGCDILTVSRQLGHTSTKHTARYALENNELKEKAVNNLPKIFNN
jgi:integrase/recombinase XerD